MSIWEECPECGALGKIDRDQYMGDVSIICSECSHHYQRETLDKGVDIPGGKVKEAEGK